MDNPDHDDDIARLLRAAGTRDGPPRELASRWEQRFRDELQPVLARRRHRRRALWGLCAGLALAAIALSTRFLPAPPPAVAIAVRQVSGAGSLQTAAGEFTGLQTGQRLATGSVISTGSDGRVALAWGDYDLRLNRDTRVRFERGHVLLEHGELYASDRHSGSRALRIDTSLAVIRDIGTQFTVAARPDRTVATVRRGALSIDTGAGELRSAAASDSASRVTIDSERGVVREAVAGTGEDWRWIYSGSPGFELEGSTAWEFLAWSTGESGLRLEFGSRAAESHARRTRLHGDISALDPERAVQPVLAGTDLVAAVVDGNTLRVALRR